MQVFVISQHFQFKKIVLIILVENIHFNFSKYYPSHLGFLYLGS